MGAMKRLLEAVYETLQDTEKFRLLGMDQQYHAALAITSDVIARGPERDGFEAQIRKIANVQLKDYEIAIESRDRWVASKRKQLMPDSSPPHRSYMQSPRSLSNGSENRIVTAETLPT